MSFKKLQEIGKGGYFQSKGDIIAQLDRTIARLQAANSELRNESDKYFNETQILNTELCRVNKENNMLCGDLQKLKRDTANLLDKNRAELSVKQKQLNCANSLADVRGKFLDQCNKERWKYQDKYAYHFKLNFILILVIFIGLILWVLK